jgi:lysophospholipase L1-like esterase
MKIIEKDNQSLIMKKILFAIALFIPLIVLSQHYGEKKSGFVYPKPTDLSGEDNITLAYNMTGGATLSDISGNGVDATVNGAVSTYKSMAFDGVNDYALFATTNVWGAGGSGSFSIRFKVNTLASDQYIATDASHSTEYLRISTNGSLLGETNTNSEFWINTNTGLVQAGKWYNFTVTCTNGVATSYLNGDSIDTETVAGYFPLRALGAAYSTGYWSNCEIEEFRMYSDALTETEAVAWHNSYAYDLIYRDSYAYGTVGNKPFEMKINSGTFLIAQSASAVLDLPAGFKYVNCTGNGSIQINLGTTNTNRTATIYFYDGSWTKHNDLLSTLITNNAWLSISGTNLVFTLTSGQRLGHLIINLGPYALAEWVTSNSVYEGHSFMAGSSSLLSHYVRQLINPLEHLNRAAAGSDMDDLNGRATNLDKLIEPELGALENILIIYIGANELDGDGDAAIAYPKLKSYTQARVASGWKVFVYTTTPATEAARGVYYETERNLFNDSIRYDLALLNNVYCLETDTITNMQDPSDATYYADGLHPTETGYQLLSDVADNQIRSLSSLAGKVDKSYEARFQSIQSSPVSQVSITFNVTPGNIVYVDWDDGNLPVQITADGGNQVLISGYVTINKTYDIRIWGDIDAITKFTPSGGNLTYCNTAYNTDKFTGI